MLCVDVYLKLLVSPFYDNDTRTGSFIIIVSPKRNKRSPNTIKGVSGRGGVGLGMTLGLNGRVGGGYPSMGIVCAQSQSVFVPLSQHTRVTGGTGTSLFVSVRAGTLTGGQATGKTSA